MAANPIAPSTIPIAIQNRLAALEPTISTGGWVGVGDGVIVGVDVCVGVGDAVGVGVKDGRGVAVGVGVREGVEVAVGVGVSGVPVISIVGVVLAPKAIKLASSRYTSLCCSASTGRA